MKKIIIWAITLFFVFAGTSLACDPTKTYCPGTIDLNAGAYQGIDETTGFQKPHFGTSGQYIVGGGGFANLSAEGSPLDGKVNAVGGALGKTYSYHFNWEDGHGVGSASHAEAMSGSGGKIEGSGKYDMEIGGGIGMYSGANSWYGGESDNPKTAGLSEQVVSGEYSGEMSGKIGKGREMSAFIDTQGHNVSESYGYKVYGDGWEVMGYGSKAESHTALQSGGTGPVSGNWDVHGIATVFAHQALGNGYAGASAIGEYTCSGVLGQNFSGSIVGGSNTNITTVHGQNGSINKAESQMSLKSSIW